MDNKTKSLTVFYCGVGWPHAKQSRLKTRPLPFHSPELVARPVPNNSPKSDRPQNLLYRWLDLWSFWLTTISVYRVPVFEGLQGKITLHKRFLQNIWMILKMGFRRRLDARQCHTRGCACLRVRWTLTSKHSKKSPKCSITICRCIYVIMKNYTIIMMD